MHKFMMMAGLLAAGLPTGAMAQTADDMVCLITFSTPEEAIQVIAPIGTFCSPSPHGRPLALYASSPPHRAGRKYRIGCATAL